MCWQGGACVCNALQRSRGARVKQQKCAAMTNNEYQVASEAYDEPNRSTPPFDECASPPCITKQS
eukprot:6478066-Amphidinium_carterae.1